MRGSTATWAVWKPAWTETLAGWRHAWAPAWTEILAVWRRLGARLDRDFGGLDRDIGGLGARLDRHMKDLGERLDRVEAGLVELRERVAHVEGLLEGLRDAFVGRGFPEPPKPRRVGG